jgi:hypothetical protein
MKFESLIEKHLKTLLEQTPQPVELQVPDAAALQPPAANVSQLPTSGDTEQQPSPLTSEGEVFLVRLLRKALFMNPDDLDEKALKDLPEIDEKNATQILNKIVSVMNNYSADLNVETPA